MDLYSKYRSSPETLTEDDNALIYASLCLARYNQLRREAVHVMRRVDAPPREHLTYYRMAREALESWDKATITATCKSRAIVPN